ncbi:hypothetical protein ACFWBR_20175 [Streptomyces sp. NPDC060006]|uniref:hypothetical protein n=1 Tax=unclassified Streptomyces TaxID=2593676 RepID=UPI00363D1AC6
MLRHSGGRPLDPRRVRLMMLTGIVVLTVALPLAVASAGPTGGEAPASARTSVRASGDALRASGHGAPAADRAPGGRASGGGSDAGGRLPGEARGAGRTDDRAPGSPAAATEDPLTLGVGLATAARCGPELTSPGGIEAQTCVLTQGRETWARTYYRNATGDGLTSVLTLMAPGDRTVRMHCVVGADDEPGLCETPRERTTADAPSYTAVAEFAESADGPLLLRSGSNSPAQTAR